MDLDLNKNYKNQKKKKVKEEIKHLEKIVRWLIGNPGGFLFAILAVVAQGFHYFLLFYNVLEDTSIAAAISYANILTAVFAGSLLLFTLAGNIAVVKVFMGIDISVNLLYYYTYKIVDKIGPDWSWLKDFPEAVIFLMLSIALPYITTKYAGRVNYERLEKYNS